MLVLDASAAVDLLLRTPRGERIAVAVATQDLLAPELLDVEVCSALARLHRSGEVSASDADAAVARFAALPVDRLSHRLVLARAWALRAELRVADAFYVSCAELLRCPLLTADARLARAALPGVTVTLVQ